MSEATVKRLRWRCRRGMRELDLLLEAYLDRHHVSMNAHALAGFEAFLNSTDMELYDWVTGRARPQDPAYAVIVDELIATGTRHR